MEIHMTLSLPREEATIPLARHLCNYSLTQLGVAETCVHDLELAVTEACANVIEHSSTDNEYEVSIDIRDHECQVRVVDSGHGFDPGGLAAAADSAAEGGRGVQLMRALVDELAFTSAPGEGTVVALTKQLSFP